MVIIDYLINNYEKHKDVYENFDGCFFSCVSRPCFKLVHLMAYLWNSLPILINGHIKNDEPFINLEDKCSILNKIKQGLAYNIIIINEYNGLVIELINT